MGTISSWIRYAFTTGDFASLPEVEPVGERDKLLTLVTIYGAPASHAQHPTVQRLRSSLETWLQHTLDQRVHNGGAQSADALLRMATQASADFLDWFASSADTTQAADLIRVECGTETPDDLPTSALYRAALDGMLEGNDNLEPERVGSRAVLALTPIPNHAEPDRVLRGARWRDDTDARYLRDLHMLLATHEISAC